MLRRRAAPERVRQSPESDGTAPAEPIRKRRSNQSRGGWFPRDGLNGLPVWIAQTPAFILSACKNTLRTSNASKTRTLPPTFDLWGFLPPNG
ncbi:hypothetical protein MTP99_007197 [Tenebrio molitor]|nr:hypothetical protein MTP99_007197 [Tenebrio molitor]